MCERGGRRRSRRSSRRSCFGKPRRATIQRSWETTWLELAVTTVLLSLVSGIGMIGEARTESRLFAKPECPPRLLPAGTCHAPRGRPTIVAHRVVHLPASLHQRPPSACSASHFNRPGAQGARMCRNGLQAERKAAGVRRGAAWRPKPSRSCSCERCGSTGSRDSLSLPFPTLTRFDRIHNRLAGGRLPFGPASCGCLLERRRCASHCTTRPRCANMTEPFALPNLGPLTQTTGLAYALTSLNLSTFRAGIILPLQFLLFYASSAPQRRTVSFVLCVICSVMLEIEPLMLWGASRPILVDSGAQVNKGKEFASMFMTLTVPWVSCTLKPVIDVSADAVAASIDCRSGHHAATFAPVPTEKHLAAETSCSLHPASAHQGCSAGSYGL